MKKHFFSYLTIAFLFLNQHASSQGEGNKWFFGNKAGLDFSTSPPTILTGSLTTNEGCSSISDAAGNLLFYTNGVYVYNKLHQFMFNGTGLAGDPSTTQSALIVKQPGNADIYYIFTIGNCGGSFGYSIVDMSLQNGLGAVTTSSVLYGPSTEKLTGIKHCNGKDVWIVSHEYQTDVFRAYLLTSAGVNISPTTSTLGPVQNITCPIGYMKSSFNGRKLALGSWGTVDLYDFDNSSGSVSHYFNISTTAPLFYGMEFSPDGTKLYASGNNQILQWDLCAGSPAAIAASEYTVATNVYNPLALQLAPNGKIYVAKYIKQHLDVIDYPNLSGAACNYADSAQSIAPNTNINGLPNFVNTYIKEPLTLITLQNCAAVSFTAPSFADQTVLNCTAPGQSVTGVSWLFGDPASGASNTSTLHNPGHTFTSPGTYTVTFVASYNFCSPDTFLSIVTIKTPAPFSVQSTPSCSGTASITSPPGNYSYLWSPGNYTNSSVSGLASGIYTVSVLDSIIGCAGSKTIQVTQLPNPTLTVNGSLKRCKGETFSISISGANTYSWSNGSTGTLLTLPANANTSYTVKGTNSVTSCSSTLTLSLVVANCTGVEEMSTETSWFKVYPVPSSSYLNIETITPASSQLFNLQGRLVLETKLESEKSRIDLTGLSDGIYILKVSTNKASAVSRIIKITE